MNETENKRQIEKIHSLIPLEDFKSILNIDDRDNKLSRFCLVTSTYIIEQYCKRQFLLKTHRQLFSEWFDLTLFLNEYPVQKILSVSALFADTNPEKINPSLYNIIPLEDMENIPCEIRLSHTINQKLGIGAIKVIYQAGYSCDDVPSDLKAACLELAVWNFNRYKSKQIGVKQMNNEKLARSNGSGFEMSMPENVKSLLEPYRRKTI